MKFLVANWKMNGTTEFTDTLLKQIISIKTNHKIIICPPYPLLYKFQSFPHELGAQNCAEQTKGAFTGEVSPILLKEVGCKYVIIGHSERRQLFKESDQTIYNKYKLLIDLGLTPIVCVGETASKTKQRNAILSYQLERIIQSDKKFLKNTIIAYEPVWCIGTGKIPTDEQINDTLGYIKQLTNNITPTLYGGSVNATNIQQILQISNVDGTLIGGASLKLDEFLKMISIQSE